MTEIEYEITYLAKSLPDNLESCEFKVLMDIYFPKNEEHPRLRLRQKGDKYELTKKQRVNENDASTQIETTVQLTKEEFEGLSKGDGKSLKKKRYFYSYEGRTAEIDIFEDNLSGLVVIEFEFPDKESKDTFAMPSFCLADVTQESFIAGGMLAGKSYEDISNHLDRFAYNKIQN